MIIHRRFTRIALNQSGVLTPLVTCAHPLVRMSSAAEGSARNQNNASASLVIVRLATLEANLNHIRLEPKLQFTNIPKVQKYVKHTECLSEDTKNKV